MRSSVPSDGPTPRSSRAAEWVIRMHSGQMSRSDEREMREWLAESPTHARDLLRTETVWRVSGALAGAPEVQAELAILRQPPQSGMPGGWHSWSRWQLAAAVIGACIGLVSLWLVLTQTTTWYETVPGEQRMLRLADGSTIALNTDSRIGVDYHTTERVVRIERGEALFQVTPNTLRPFIVHAGTGSVRAVGTRFNVLVEGEAVTVTVLEGRVEVAAQQNSPAPNAHALLDARQSTAYGGSGRLLAVDAAHASVERIVAWREGRLRFDAWPLEQAIREHNRYAVKPIRLGTAEMAQTQVSGVFRVGDTDALVHALGDLIEVRAIDRGNELLLVRSASASLTGGPDSLPGKER